MRRYLASLVFFFVPLALVGQQEPRIDPGSYLVDKNVMVPMRDSAHPSHVILPITP
jgi:hypothetical protein